ncbi:hypothetical protein [Caballeronia cordobensis]|uniref:hypothetical protein n=1 Tax=Caballeronia cordobensis TaxID=1353886 RepID=UPI001364B7BF|nr:hypothetical protein [Caballeronia cordobensis]
MEELNRFRDAEMIEMTVVLLLLGAALVVYLSNQNGDDRSMTETKERKLRERRKDRQYK